MIDETRYIDFLNKVIACISNGDYDAIKELANIEMKKVYKDKNE